MSSDNGTPIFMPIGDFEHSIRGLTPAEAREARISHVREGIRAYWAEVNWKSSCRPSYWLLCLIPPLWPILWYRGVLSIGARHAFGVAIHECRRQWADDLSGVDLPYEGIPDPRA